MDARWVIGFAGLALAACSPAETAVTPEPPLGQTVAVAPATAAATRYTGVIRARTESNLGFRVGGKIFERLVDPGDHVRLGQPLMRLDRPDLKRTDDQNARTVSMCRGQSASAIAAAKTGPISASPRTRP